MSRFYITTPIYYVNAVPHLGTFYTTVVADALARYHRARYGGQNVFFLTGLDEHGQKIERIAREKGMEPQAYCDEIAAKFEKTWERTEISNDAFVRTSRSATTRDGVEISRHRDAVHAMWKRMEAAEDIYEAEYDGMYCVGCEEAKSEDDVVLENDQKVCPIHRTPVERVKEKNYFFRLSRYASRLLTWYGDPSSPVRPESRRNEVRAFVEGGLRDLSVSRMAVKWGIPVPDDPAHVVYVWIDALTNYLTALGGPEAVARGEGRGVFWADAHHLIAKDILRFHAVYWPAMLMSAGLPPPKHVLCHGYLTVKGQKISKSIPATRVDPNAIADELGVEPLRYFVLREYVLGGDGDFTYEALFQRYESDLGNDLGNLLNRTVSMAHKFVGAHLAARKPRSSSALDNLMPAVLIHGLINECWDNFSPSKALELTWGMVRAANVYIDRSAPWHLAKNGQLEELEGVLSVTCEVLRRAALYIAPVMPSASREILRQLGRSEDEATWPEMHLDGWPGGTLVEPKPIFPRFEADRQATLIAKWMPVEPPPAGDKTAAPATAANITFDDFTKIDLRAAKVVAAERVPKADKLLKLTLDVGGEQRTVVSGIAPAYAPEAMVGRTVIYLANLAPRKIRGVESQGMILAAGDAEVLALSGLDRDVPPGTRIR